MGKDDDELKTVVAMPPKPEPETIESESFTTDSKLHRARLERQKKKPGLVPRPIASFFIGVLLIAAVFMALKLGSKTYGEDIAFTISEALSNMREWFFK